MSSSSSRSTTDSTSSSIPSSRAEILEKLGQVQKELSKRKAFLYNPYPKQAEFHNSGSESRERLFLAGNQLGKTTSGAAEAAYHATGLYPEWWKGRRFNHPTMGWVSGNSNETTRDNPQRMLLGRIGESGTGMIPSRCIHSVLKARGIGEYVDTLKVKHVSGDLSTIRFKAYEQGADKWQGDTLDYVWFDEEPPQKIYDEGLTRTNHGDGGKGGIAWITATPLMGMTDVIGRFYPQPDIASRDLVQMTIQDVTHYSAEQIDAIISAYQPHERDARARGIPALGSGRVFPVKQSDLEVTPFDIPDHWYQLAGIDFGWDHPTAAIQCAIDRDTDTFYVTKCYARSETTTGQHAIALQAWGSWLPFAWPHDGYQHDRSSGDQIAMQYRDMGIKMMPEHATHPAGGTSVEAGVQDMLEAMMQGRFKVFAHLNEWWDEFNVFHRKDGKIVKKRDDRIAATRYAWMMKRYAVTKGKRRQPDIASPYNPFHPKNERVYYQ